MADATPTKTSKTKTARTREPRRKKSSTEQIFGTDVMRHGYTAVPNVLVRAQARLGLSTTQFNIVVQLLSYWIDPDQPPFPPKKELAQRMSITPDTLRINIKALQDRGLLEREQQVTSYGDYGSNIYRLDRLVERLKVLVPDFDEEREERRASKRKTEVPNAKAKARAAAAKANAAAPEAE